MTSPATIASKQKTLLEPSVKDVLADLKTDIFRSMNCVKVGRIASFNRTKKTAEVAIQLKRVLPDGTVGDYPALVDVPVFTLSGGGGSLMMPVAAGDDCLLLFSDRNIDAWYTGAGAAPPMDSRCHDLSDAIALVGLSSLASSIGSYPVGELAMKYGDARLGMKDNKVQIGNQAQTMKTLLDTLLELLQTIQTVPGGGPLDADSIAALEGFKSSVDQLLY